MTRISGAFAIVPRPRLFHALDGAQRVTALCAPRGYGKSVLLGQYVELIRQRGDFACTVLCLADDLRPAHLAAALVRGITRCSGEQLFDHLASEYHHLTQHDRLQQTPGALAQAIALDLVAAPHPLTLVIDGLIGLEQISFVIELARRSDGRHRFLLAGGDVLASLVMFVDLDLLLLTGDDLLFTPYECTEAGVSFGDHCGWPAAMVLMDAPSGYRNSLDAYLDQILGGLGDDLVLIRAALLDVWAPKAVGESALGLPRGWIQRFVELGSPLLPGLGEGEYIPHPLFRAAMLRRLEAEGELTPAQLALAQALEVEFPLKALELQSSVDAHSLTGLQLARQEVPRWVAEHQWSQLRQFLTPHVSRLTVEEAGLYARSCLGMAGTASELRDAVQEVESLRQVSGFTPEIACVLCELQLRLGQPGQALAILGEIFNHQQQSSSFLQVIAWRSFAQLELGQWREVITVLNGLRIPNARASLELLIVQAAAYLAAGEPQDALNYALRAHTVYVYNPALIAEQLMSVFVLADTLTDLGEIEGAAFLLSKMPFVGQENHWVAVRALLSQALLAFRSLTLPMVQEHLDEVVRRAQLGGHVDLNLKAEVRLVLLLLKNQTPVAARHHLGRVRELSHHDSFHLRMLSGLEGVIAAYEGHGFYDEFSATDTVLPVEILFVKHQFLAGRTPRGLSRPQLNRCGPGVVGSWLTQLPAEQFSPSTLRVNFLTAVPSMLLDDTVLTLAPKPLSILAYITLHSPVSTEALLSDCLSSSTAQRKYLNKLIRQINTSLSNVLGDGRQDLVLVYDKATETFSLPPGLNLQADIFELCECAYSELPRCFSSPASIFDGEAWFEPYFAQAVRTVASRIQQMPWPSGRAVADQLVASHSDQFELLDALEQRYLEYGEFDDAKRVHAVRSALLI